MKTDKQKEYSRKCYLKNREKNREINLIKAKEYYQKNKVEILKTLEIKRRM